MAKKTDKTTGIESETDDQFAAEVAEVAEPAADTEGLVKMHLNGISLHVHPTTVKAHEDAGWKVA